MPFTGRIGTNNSQLGNIVLGIVDAFGLGTFGFSIHVLSSRQIRVQFESHVTDTAIVSGNYSLTVASGPAVVPGFLSVSFDDDLHRSVVIECDVPLTYGATYSMQIFGVVGLGGENVSSTARNFIASVQDPPRAVGAFQSRHGMVDIYFDRPVGPSSSSATAAIRDASLPGPTFAMTLIPWAGETLLPEEAVRFSLPPGMAPADSFAIDFSDVVDESLNVSSGTVLLSLALRSPTPYSYADLTQLQIADAWVSDVSNDFLNAGTVRVFFNCPVLNAWVTGNWTASLIGPHPVQDTAHAVTAPNCIDVPTFVTLLNDIKAKLNSHFLQEFVHIIPDTADVITSPNASDLVTGCALLAEAQLKYLSHIANQVSHVYDDTIHTFTPISPDVGNPLLDFAIANQLKTKYNDHLLPEYPINFSLSYPFGVNQISEFSRWSTSPLAPQADSPHTFYVDLHLSMKSNKAQVSLKASLTSEEGGSVTSVLDYTGSIVARPTNSRLVVLSSSVMTDASVSVRMDREVQIPDLEGVAVLGPSGFPLPIRRKVLKASLPAVIWTLNSAIVAYSWHIDSAFANSAGHQIVDTVNLVNSGSYVFTASDVAMIISKANAFKSVLNSHMVSDVYHMSSDPQLVSAPNATDMDSLIALVADIRAAFMRHNVRLGAHLWVGHLIASARLFDTVHADFDLMVDGLQHRTVSSLKSVYRDLRLGTSTQGFMQQVPSGEDVVAPVLVDRTFTGIATRPSVASALPRPGLVETDDGVRFESDAVDVFFSKPMYRVPLDSSNVPITGGVIQVKEASWTGPRTASVRVSKMEQIAYNVQAVGLTDEAGNPVY